jgi:hypothetical protein
MAPDEYPRSNDLDPFAAGRPEQRTVAADHADCPRPQCTREELDVIPIRAGIVREPHEHDEMRVQRDAIEHSAEFYARELRTDPTCHFAILRKDLRGHDKFEPIVDPG